MFLLLFSIDHLQELLIRVAPLLLDLSWQTRMAFSCLRTPRFATTRMALGIAFFALIVVDGKSI